MVNPHKSLPADNLRSASSYSDLQKLKSVFFKYVFDVSDSLLFLKNSCFGFSSGMSSICVTREAEQVGLIF